MSLSRGVDLSSLASTASGQQTGTAGGGSFVIDATEQNFQDEVLQASMQHVVVVSLWSPRAAQSTAFNDILAKVTNSYGGQILLANVDIDANPTIAQAFQAQGVPYVIGLVKGQPVPLFQGTAEESDVKRYFDELVRVAEQNGVSGRAAPRGEQAPQEPDAEPEPDPRFAAADEAFANQDFDTAIAEYERLAKQYPGETEIAERLAGVKLMARTKDADLQQARQAAADHPDDVHAQFLVADLDVSGGHVDDAFDRLIDLVRRTSGEEREEVRQRLVELFTVVGSGDSRVGAARRKLAAALF